MSRGQLLRNGLRYAESFDVLSLRYLRTEPGGGRSPLPTQEGWLFTCPTASLLEDSLLSSSACGGGAPKGVVGGVHVSTDANTRGHHLYRATRSSSKSQHCGSAKNMVPSRGITSNRATRSSSKRQHCGSAKNMVRMRGLEPPRRKTLEPKSSASTNSATSARFGSALFSLLDGGLAIVFIALI